MTRVFLILFLCFFSLSCCAQAYSDPYLWDFGQVKKGEKVAHAFILKNESSTIMQIKGINTSCGCTASKSDKKILLPQESTLIEVQFNSKGYSGAVQQFIYVNTDSLDKPIIRFIIKATVVKESS